MTSSGGSCTGVQICWNKSLWAISSCQQSLFNTNEQNLAALVPISCLQISIIGGVGVWERRYFWCFLFPYLIIIVGTNLFEFCRKTINSRLSRCSTQQSWYHCLLWCSWKYRLSLSQTQITMPENVHYLKYLTFGVSQHTQRPYPAMTSLGLCSSLLSYWEITERVTHILELCVSCLLCSDLAHHYQKISHYLHLCSPSGFLRCCVARIVFGFSVDPTRSGTSFSSSNNLEYRYFSHISLCKFRGLLCLVLYSNYAS